LDLQSMFDRFNQRYWCGRLPRYRVIQSDRFGGRGMCRRRQKTIHIADGLCRKEAEITLLHEMCHAATRGGHGNAWLAEMLRLAKMGAPTKQEWLGYQPSAHPRNCRAILAEFEDAGFECPGTGWAMVRRNIGYSYGLVDRRGRVESKESARFLRRARRMFCEGRKERKFADAVRRAYLQQRSAAASQEGL
jgi:hypothetical protein